MAMLKVLLLTIINSSISKNDFVLMMIEQIFSHDPDIRMRIRQCWGTGTRERQDVVMVIVVGGGREEVGGVNGEERVRIIALT